MFLMLLAVFPSIYLIWYVYKMDGVEKEPVRLLAKVFGAGVLSAVPAVALEMGFQYLFAGIFRDSESALYLLLQNFIGVALVEEFCKREAIKRRVWNEPEFNCTFDGIVYCVCGSLGFATIENILYIFNGGGYQVAVMRALMAIPLHAFCGVYMGYYFGMAKKAAQDEYEARSETCMTMCLIVPMLIHGAYDFLLSLNYDWMMIAIVVFCVVLDVMAIKRIRNSSRDDMPFWY